ncbi:MAG: hypothetical protein JW760_05370 [Spirochaetales bacterium]|nr:hypothetical protein [Spirochaetales bacterium]
MGDQLLPRRLPDRKDLDEAFTGMILSASGWRKVFAPSGREEDTDGRLKPPDAVLAAAAGAVFGRLLAAEGSRPVCALGTDTRPTGPTLAEILGRSLSAAGLQVRYLGPVAAPEIMACAGRDPEVSSFLYVSASHNPVGHNGFKFGLSDGGVLGGKAAEELIEAFKSLWFDTEALEQSLAAAVSTDRALWTSLVKESALWKKASFSAYYALTREVVSGSADPAVQEAFFTSLKKAGKPLACLADFNGSARTTTLDREILAEAGVTLYTMNDRPGDIAHRIVPEGESLIPCMEELERLYGEDKSCLFGYMPDNDGDRGNLVYLDTGCSKAKIVEAQEVFALAVYAELLSEGKNFETGEEGKLAVVVNGPTSRRIERIADALGVRVFRCEVGEANVVELARKKRTEGYRVRILGEGSNGGNITHPSSVRDPVNTVFSLLKLLLLKSGSAEPFADIRAILASLPAFTTTGAYEEGAKIRIKTRDQGALKAAWEEIFLRDWERKKQALERNWGITGWEEVNYEGIEEKRGFGPACRSGRQKGGLTMLLKSPSKEILAFLWMRGSGTEPVFRILVDVEGDNVILHDELLAWHRAMVLEADDLAGKLG